MIQLNDVTLRRGAKVLLQGASATIHPGEKIGLIGRNGAGKSTLLALFSGALHEDRGEFSIPAHWRLAQVAQHMPETDQPATDFVLAGDERLSLLRQQHQCRASGRRHGHGPGTCRPAGRRRARRRARAQALILGLGFCPASSISPSTASRAAGACACSWRAR
jgi:ATP-binding cassette subfamily F protein 3